MAPAVVSLPYSHSHLIKGCCNLFSMSSGDWLKELSLDELKCVGYLDEDTKGMSISTCY
jgi:hypothetical protein